MVEVDRECYLEFTGHLVFWGPGTRGVWRSERVGGAWLGGSDCLVESDGERRLPMSTPGRNEEAEVFSASSAQWCDLSTEGEGQKCD